MRSWMILGLLVCASTMAFCARQVTVQELTKTIVSLHQAGKSDNEVAASLQQMQLKEELTAGAAAELQQYLPGPLSKDQLAVLRGLSAFEPSVPSQPPTSSASDPSALLARAASWMASTFKQIPAFTVSEVINRFDQNSQNLDLQSPDALVNYQRSSSARTDSVEVSEGVERLLNPGEQTHWGENGKISEGGPNPALPELFQEASAFGKPTFARWEVVDGKSAAVFTFSIEKKKSHYTVDYCCFPFAYTENASITPSGDAVILPTTGIMRTHSWRPFKKTVPYHGLLYIDSASGAILRTVTIVELKPYDYLHFEEVRIDYAMEILDGKTYVAPVRKVTLNETVPGADTRPVSYPVLRSLMTAEYVNYHTSAQ